VAAGAVTVTAATKKAPATVAVRDTKGDARGDKAPDLVRASLGRGSDGRLRATFSLAAKLTPADLRATSGPPGSLCLRMWTTSEPPDQPEDFLACVTAQADDTLRGTVMRENTDGLPNRVGPAAVSLRDGRIVILRFSQSAIGRPKTIRFAAEGTRAGCARTSCIDTAPDAPATATFKLG
jgi:hypothetical protein